MDKKHKTLGEFIIENQSSFQYSSGELSKLINAIRLAAKVVNHEVNKAGLIDVLGAAGDTNIQGEDQQKLDVLANEKFIQTLTNREIVCGIASEEEDDFISINSNDNNNQNKYVVLIDPLDGSSNIDVNVSVGTIFSIYRRVTPVGTPVQLEDFLQKGNEQVAAGYIVYGTSTMLVYTTGDGVNGVRFRYNVGDFQVLGAYDQDNDGITGTGDTENSSIHFAYTFSDWTVALGYANNENDGGQESDGTVLTVGGTLGIVDLAFFLADDDVDGRASGSNTSYGISGAVEVGAATQIQAAISDSDETDTSWGIGVVHDLGGGVSIKGMIGQESSNGNNVADLGVQFNF